MEGRPCSWRTYMFCVLHCQLLHACEGRTPLSLGLMHVILNWTCHDESGDLSGISALVVMLAITHNASCKRTSISLCRVHSRCMPVNQTYMQARRTMFVCVGPGVACIMMLPRTL